MIFLIPLLFLVSSVSHAAVFNVTAVKFKVYGVWVSTNQDCSNPLKVFENVIPEEVNFVSNPQIGGGDIPDGVYNCVMVKMSDRIILEHNATGACSGFSTQPLDIFESGSYRELVDSFPSRFEGMYTSSTRIRGDAVIDGVLVDESPLFPADSNENQVFLFLSTGSVVTGRAGYHRPRQSGDNVFGEKLNNPFVVNGATAGTFQVIGLSQITDQTTDGQACAFAGSTSLNGIVWDFQ